MKIKLILFLIIASGCLFNSASASVITVTTLSAEGAGSLRAAIGSAASGDSIIFSVAGTITLDSAITWNKSLFIAGPGSSSLAIDGGGTTNMFNIYGGSSAITGLAFNHGNGADGGCIYAPAGATVDTTAIIDCAFSGSSSSTAGGAVQCSTNRFLIIKSSSIDHCTATNLGGGLVAFYGCVLKNCTFSNCSAPVRAGFGWIVNNGSSVSNCTFYNNSTTGVGGALEIQAQSAAFNISLVNNTFDGNTAGTSGSAVYVQGTNATNSTLPHITLQNNIFYSDSANYGQSSPIITNETSNGGNISNDGTLSNYTQGPHDANYLNPLLSTAGLQNNGGPNLTVALQCTSPAINIGIAAGAPSTDERGILRTGGIDAGAYQYQIITGSQTLSICGSGSVTVGAHIYTQPGIYTDTLTTVGGCDSILTTTVTANSVDSTVTLVGTTLIANNGPGKTFQWINCDNYQPLAGDTGLTFTPQQTGNYAVEVSQNGCTDTSVCTNVTVLGINRLNVLTGITVYPNPATDVLTVITSGQIDRLIIYSSLGQKVIEQTAPTANKVDVRNLAPGVYIVDVQIGGLSGRVRFVKED